MCTALTLTSINSESMKQPVGCRRVLTQFCRALPLGWGTFSAGSNHDFRVVDTHLMLALQSP